MLVSTRLTNRSQALHHFSIHNRSRSRDATMEALAPDTGTSASKVELFTYATRTFSRVLGKSLVYKRNKSRK